MEIKRKPYIYILNQFEVTVIDYLIQKITTDPSEDSELFCQQVKQLSVQLPKRILDEINLFAKFGSETGFFLIKGIYMDKNEIPITPPENNYKIGEKTRLAKIQALFLSIISEMIAYEAEGYGGLFQDIVPNKSMHSQQTSLGSSELEIHTEQAFSDLKPDILSLACLKGDKNALTYILPLQDIILNLSNSEYSLLNEPLWKTKVDLSFKQYGKHFKNGDIRGPLPIISGSVLNPNFVFDQDLMFGLTLESEEMIQKIIDIYYKYRRSYNLVKGDIILIDNRKAVHGRSSFSPKYDGTDRFLIRCFGTFDYEKSEYARFGRIVLAEYS